MTRGDVVRGDIATRASAAQGHGGIQAGRQSYRSMRRRRVHADPERRLLEPELQDDIFVLRVDGHGVAHPAVAQNLDATLASLAPVLDDVPGQDRRELLYRK